MTAFLLMACFLPSWVGAGEGREPLVITADMQFEYAGRLFSEEDYGAAAVEYKRFLHFFPGDRRENRAMMGVATCYFSLGRFQEAAKILNDLTLRDPDNTRSTQAYFMLSRCFVKMGNLGYARVVLQNLLKLTEDSDTRDRIFERLAQINLAQAGQFVPGAVEQAEKHIASLTPEGAQRYDKPGWDRMFRQLEQAPKKSPAAAGILAVIPGGGHLYTERYHDAFFSFVLNTGMILSAYESYDHEHYALGALISLVGAGFYTGNIHGAITSAHKYNRAVTLDILERRLTLSQRFDPGGFLISMDMPF